MILALALACAPASVRLEEPVARFAADTGAGDDSGGADTSDGGPDTDTAGDTDTGTDTAGDTDTGTDTAGDTSEDTAGDADTGTDTAGDTSEDTASEDTASEDTASEDTASDTAEDTGDTGSGCSESVALGSSAVTWVWPASAQRVTVTGCMTAITVTCPSWVFVSYSPTMVYEGVPTFVEIEPDSSAPIPSSGTCDIGGESLTVSYTY